MNHLREPYKSYNNRIFSIIGFWPSLSKIEKWIKAFVTIVANLVLFIPLLISCIVAVRSSDLNVALECFSALVVSTMSVMQIVNLIIHDQELLIILEKIEKDWKTWLMEPEMEILKKDTITSKYFRIIYGGSILGAGCCYMMVPLVPPFLDLIKPLNESRPKLPMFSTEVALSTENHFYTIFVINFFATYVVVVNYLYEEMMFMAYNQHACSIYKAIGCKLSKLVINKYSKLSERGDLQKTVKADIIFCIKQHEDLLIFVKNIHKVYSYLYLIVVLLNVLIISSSGVATVLNLHQPVRAFKFFATSSMQVFHIVCLTIPCQELCDQSYNVSYSVSVCFDFTINESVYNIPNSLVLRYKSDWYTLPLKYQKLLLMIMHRSYEPCEFICGRIYIFSMKNVTMVIKTSISYFTVLCSFQ